MAYFGEKEFPAMSSEARAWLEEIAATWAGYWKNHDMQPAHRYKMDFAAFVGERFMTDFNLRDIERKYRATDEA